MARATRRKSMIPVDGLHNPRTPTTCGSISRMRAASTSSSPGVPFAMARSCSVGEPRQLALVERDDQLSAALERDVVRLGERLDRGLALAAQLRLERPRLVVQAGVQDAAVVAGLVGRELGLLLHDREAQRWPSLQQPICRRQPDDAAADHDDVESIAHVAGIGNGNPTRSPSSRSVAPWMRSITTPCSLGPSLRLGLGLAVDQHAARRIRDRRGGDELLEIALERDARSRRLRRGRRGRSR